jgi:hypothetical protein
MLKSTGSHFSSGLIGWAQGDRTLANPFSSATLSSLKFGTVYIKSYHLPEAAVWSQYGDLTGVEVIKLSENEFCVDAYNKPEGIVVDSSKFTNTSTIPTVILGNLIDWDSAVLELTDKLNPTDTEHSPTLNYINSWLTNRWIWTYRRGIPSGNFAGVAWIDNKNTDLGLSKGGYYLINDRNGISSRSFDIYNDGNLSNGRTGDVLVAIGYPTGHTFTSNDAWTGQPEFNEAPTAASTSYFILSVFYDILSAPICARIVLQNVDSKPLTDRRPHPILIDSIEVLNQGHHGWAPSFSTGITTFLAVNLANKGTFQGFFQEIDLPTNTQDTILYSNNVSTYIGNNQGYDASEFSQIVPLSGIIGSQTTQVLATGTQWFIVGMPPPTIDGSSRFYNGDCVFLGFPVAYFEHPDLPSG